MKFVWELRDRGFKIAGEHETFTESLKGIRRMITRGIYIGHTTGTAELFKLTWDMLRRLTVVEDYDDAGSEDKVRKVVNRWRQHFRDMGRRVSVVKVDYEYQDCLPSMFADGIHPRDQRNRVPARVVDTMELE